MKQGNKLFLCLSIFCIKNYINADIWREGPTEHPSGCYDFVGLVKCKNGSKILSTAKIELWEDDLFWDDHLHTQKLYVNEKTAGFSFQKCVDDGRILLIGPKFENIELYYYFKNVCVFGDKYKAETVAIESNNNNKTNVYILDGKYAYLFLE